MDDGVKTPAGLLDRAAGRLLFLAPSAYPLGGVATWLDYIVPGLRGRGWDVTLGLVEGLYHDVDAYLKVHPDPRVVRVPYGTGTYEGRVRRLRGAMRRVRPDAVIAVNIGEAPAAIERLRVSSAWSPRLVTTLHGLHTDLTAGGGAWAHVTDAVICTNRLTCALVAKSGSLAEERVHYSPYGVEIPDRVRSTSSGDGERPLHIAFVGRLEDEQKRVRDLASVVGELDRRGADYELVVAGGGPDEALLRSGMANAAAKGRVRFLGTLSGAALAECVYGWADALLITSCWETGPIVAWEAMAHGSVVVTSRYVGSGLEGSLVDGENCLMFPIGGAAAAVDCLLRLGDFQFADRIRRGGAALVRARYSKAVSIAAWDACLRRIMMEAPRALPPGHRPAADLPPSGRLDCLLGPWWAENIREALHLTYRHSEAGSEWPHASRGWPEETEEFWKLAMALDGTPGPDLPR